LGLMSWYQFWGSYSDEEHVAFQSLASKVSSIAATLPDAWLSAKCLNCLWGEAIFRGRYSDARELCGALIRLSETRNDPRPKGFAYWQRGCISILNDECDQAIVDAREALGIALAPFDRTFARYVEGSALALSGRPERGFLILDELRRIAEAGGNMPLIMISNPYYGAAISLSGRLGNGIRFIRESTRKTESWGNIAFPIIGHMVLGEAYLRMATSSERPPLRLLLKNVGFVLTNVPFALSKAQRYLDEALRRCRTVEMPGYLAQCLYDLGLLHKARKRLLEARACLTEALGEARSVAANKLALKIENAIASL
jgi:tetratricopeptide (TPR) repeat protein